MLIAMLTDFGTSDYYVAAMKGVILSINPQANIVDVTHEIKPQNIDSAEFILRAVYGDFPVGTIFLCVVDPGVGSARRAIIVKSQNYIFVGPDNGTFSFVITKNTHITSIENDSYFRKPVSNTFHGRDVFAPTAAHLSIGVPPAEFGPEVRDPVTLPSPDLRPLDNGELEGRIIYIDRFGNLVTNITAEQARSAFQLEISGRLIIGRRTAYAGAEPGKPFLVVGSAGFIEVSINGGSAAELLKASVGTPFVLRFI
jgi:S-adenosylmethionine hydrolase